MTPERMVVSPTAQHRDGVSKRKGEKEYNINIREVRVEASPHLKKSAIDIAKKQVQRYLIGELTDFHDVSKEIKKAIESGFDGTWHVIVGLSFGSFVTYEASCVIYIFFGNIGVLMFKHG